MLILLFVFLLRLAVLLSRSSTTTGFAASPMTSEPTRRRDGLTLRLLQGETRVWVTDTHDEQPLEAGGMVSSKGELSLGRAPGNDIRLEDPFSSAYHARVRRQRHGFLVEDLGTTNGTRVNGVRIRTPVRVEAGDIIDIGSTSFAVE